MTSSDQRMSEIATTLQAAGLGSVVMGGHAVRYYGVDRNTVDYDFFAGARSTQEIRDVIACMPALQDAAEGPSWRPDEFVRFRIGVLPDGRDEWLEFWLHNHLLPKFETASGRVERGMYGGKQLAFLALEDLLRSKETERADDWHDISLLEEIQDERLVAAASSRHENIVAFLSRMRSRRGFDRARAQNLFADNAVVRSALSTLAHPVTYAYLLPLANDQPPPTALIRSVEAGIESSLRTVEFASLRHMGLVEVVRRAYQRAAINEDRAEKQRVLQRQQSKNPE